MIIFSIPHGSTVFPDKVGFRSEELLQAEVALLTDWYVEEIFANQQVVTLTAKTSRVYCDVERLPDTIEPMAKSGMGIIYTKTDDGRDLRQISSSKRRQIMERYYLPYHQALADAVAKQLQVSGRCLIIDCHSFSDQPFQRDLDQSVPRPDICLGTDDFHTPAKIVQQTADFFRDHGLSVKINSPYAGTIVPQMCYMKNPAVSSLMIEINRKLYFDGTKADHTKIAQLNKLIRKLTASY